MGYHMIKGLTAHYKKKGEHWKIDGSDKAARKKDVKPAPVVQRNKVESDPKLSLLGHTAYRHDLKCDTYVSSSNISFSLVTDVIMSWQMITAVPNWDKDVGDLFLRYIFKVEPATIELFGFPADTDYTDPNLTSNMKFVTKGVVLIKAIDTAVQMLGPDLFPIEEVLFDLGKRHVYMKAQPEFWPIVGEALFLVFEERLGAKFRGNIRDAWTVMYNFLGYHMIQGLKHQYKELKTKH